MTERLCAPLEPEDFVVQSMSDASPVKWHLAHTTWFFETFLLSRALPDYQYALPSANFLFNSYYNAIGERIARDRRGLLSRPTTEEIFRCRAVVDERVGNWLADASPEEFGTYAEIFELGLHHEQQHQELIVTDLKHAFGSNPTRPAYRTEMKTPASVAAPLGWVEHEGGVVEIGHEGPGFSFDNEGPRHRVYLAPFRIATRPVLNGEYRAFIESGGYESPEFWLSEGWATRLREGWKAPLYWEKSDCGWNRFGLAGMEPLDEQAPVSHVSFFEADAFARWMGARLPSEGEWETVAAGRPISGQFLESGPSDPVLSGSDADLIQGLFGTVWEWTGSPYLAYPGYRPVEGALGEYNGKFMCNQFVLRGGSCATPRSHLRATYRNFFPPSSRWQFSGIRLAADAD